MLAVHSELFLAPADLALQGARSDSPWLAFPLQFGALHHRTAAQRPSVCPGPEIFTSCEGASLGCVGAHVAVVQWEHPADVCH